MPAFYWRDSNKSDINHNNKISETRLTNEINILKILTKSIVNTNISPHFVKLIGVNECMNADDLFIKNVLGTFESVNSNKHYRYKINRNTYDVPVGVFFAKINDFGFTNLNEDYHDRKLTESNVQDFYNFVFDIYDGGNLGGDSLFRLFSSIKNKNDRKKKIKTIERKK
jgi:hypothetical protein